MRTFLLAGLMAAVSSGALAQDASSGFNWTGAYVGVQNSYLGVVAESGEFAPGLIRYDRSDVGSDGFTVGGLVGYNFQFSNNLVLGGEADISLASADSDDQPLFRISDGALLPGNEMGLETNWTASIRARMGYAFDRIMPYATGGVAFINYDASFDFPLTGPLSHGATDTGWTVGGGVDYALADHVIVKVEYRFSDFGEKTFPTPGFPDNPTYVDVQTHDAKFAVSYKF